MSEAPSELLWLDEADSTHMLLKSPAYAHFPELTMLLARRQTAGRGQRGNSWESEPLKNLTFSMAAIPQGVTPAEQFVISEGVALAITDVLADYGIEASVKWPNDIYVADRKICGILIDHSLQGSSITRSIISAGINVNQTRFLSDAPNPVSMAMLTGCDHQPDPLAIRLRGSILQALETMRTPAGRHAIHTRFLSSLYRHDGAPHKFFDHRRQETIEAIITDVAPTGILTLQPLPAAGCAPRSYAFKEVSFII